MRQRHISDFFVKKSLFSCIKRRLLFHLPKDGFFRDFEHKTPLKKLLPDTPEIQSNIHENN